MKTRIKVVEMMDGTKNYYPQFKTFLFWHYLYACTMLDELGTRDRYNSRQEAQKCLDEYIKERHSEKVKSIHYIKGGE